MTEKTLSIIKPDAVSKNIIGKIISRFEDNGLEIIAAKLIRLSDDEASGFYAEHQGKPFFNALKDFMTSGPVFIQVLQGENAISRNRELMGATNPTDAEEGTLRKKYGISIDKNSVHGSDSTENAKIELDFFFKD